MPFCISVLFCRSKAFSGVLSMYYAESSLKPDKKAKQAIFLKLILLNTSIFNTILSE